MIISAGKSGKVAYVPMYYCVISKSLSLVAGPFGPCYILTGSDSKTGYSFKAHINDCTDCESIPSIFKALAELGVKINDLSLKLLGGWKDQEEIKFWGDKLWGYQIIDQLKNLGVYKQTKTKRLHEKKFLPIGKYPDSGAYDKHYFHGSVLKKGNLELFKGPYNKLKNIPNKLSEKYEKVHEDVKKEMIEKFRKMAIEGEIKKTDLDKKSLDLTIDGRIVKVITTKKIGNTPVREVHVKPRLKPLKIFVVENENKLVEVS
jgi:hypothetical protein